MAPKRGENCPISGRRKKRRILSRLWLSWFFQPRNSSALFLDFLLISAVPRVQGRFQNPRQTPVRTKLRLKRFPTIIAIPHVARYFLREASSFPKQCDPSPCCLAASVPLSRDSRSNLARYPPKLDTPKTPESEEANYQRAA